MHQRAEVWQKVWKAEVDAPEPLRPGDFGLESAPPLPVPSVARIRAVSRSFAPGTSYGNDGLHPRHIAMLSDVGIQAFIDVFVATKGSGGSRRP